MRSQAFRRVFTLLLLRRAVAPVQGQVLRVNAPEIKHYYGFDDTTYVIPNTDTVVLGGSTDRVASDTVNATTDDEVGLRSSYFCHLRSFWPFDYFREAVDLFW